MLFLYLATWLGLVSHKTWSWWWQITSLLSSHKDRKDMNIHTAHLEEKEIITEDESGKKWLRQHLRVRTRSFWITCIFPIVKKFTRNTQAFAFWKDSCTWTLSVHLPCKVITVHISSLGLQERATKVFPIRSI